MLHNRLFDGELCSMFFYCKAGASCYKTTSNHGVIYPSIWCSLFTSLHICWINSLYMYTLATAWCLWIIMFDTFQCHKTFSCCDIVVAHRTHFTVSAYQIFGILHTVREANVLECKHIVHQPIILQQLRFVFLGRFAFLMHQRQFELQLCRTTTKMWKYSWWLSNVRPTHKPPIMTYLIFCVMTTVWFQYGQIAKLTMYTVFVFVIIDFSFEFAFVCHGVVVWEYLSVQCLRCLCRPANLLVFLNGTPENFRALAALLEANRQLYSLFCSTLLHYTDDRVTWHRIEYSYRELIVVTCSIQYTFNYVCPWMSIANTDCM